MTETKTARKPAPKREAPRVRRNVELRKPGQVTVDLRVQRPLDPRRVTDLVNDWDDNALDVPKVSQRTGGEVIWLDGQHRGAALVRMGRGEQSIEMLVYRGLTLAEEAALFRALNTSKRLSPLDLFAVALTEEDTTAWQCQGILDRLGLKPASGLKNSFTAVNTLWKLVERDCEATEMAMNLLVRAWGPVREAVDGRLVAGASEFVIRRGTVLNLDGLREKLAKEPGGPSAFIGRARSLAQVSGTSVPDGVAEILTNLYNKNRRTGVLPPWRA